MHRPGPRLHPGRQDSGSLALPYPPPHTSSRAHAASTSPTPCARQPSAHRRSTRACPGSWSPAAAGGSSPWGSSCTSPASCQPSRKPSQAPAGTHARRMVSTVRGRLCVVQSPAGRRSTCESVLFPSPYPSIYPSTHASIHPSMHPSIQSTIA
eukprot:364232-Chlamydomonas_euryale.AAC.5